MQWRVKDQVIVVTGASKGIGFGIAKCLLARGAKVALLARGAERLQQAVAALQSDDAIGIAVDVSNKQCLTDALEQVWQRWGRLDGIVNNVGAQFARRIELMPEDEVRRLVDMNLIGTIFGSQCAIPFLRKNGGGRIINISSSAVRDKNEFAHIALYTACKAGIDLFTKELREEVMADNIMVTLFSSGSVFTGSVDNFDPVAARDALAAWQAKGKYYRGGTTPDVMGEAVAQCFEYPPQILADFIEVRPGQHIPKELEDTSSN